MNTQDTRQILPIPEAMSASRERFRYEHRIEQAKQYLGSKYLCSAPAKPLPALIRKQA